MYLALHIQTWLQSIKMLVPKSLGLVEEQNYYSVDRYAAKHKMILLGYNFEAENITRAGPSLECADCELATYESSSNNIFKTAADKSEGTNHND